MSKLKEALRAKPTGIEKPIFHPVLRAETTDNPSPATGMGAFEHILLLDLEVRFCANTAQYQTAYEAAVKYLFHELYSDVHRWVHHIEMAWLNHDSDEFHRALKELRKEITA